MNLSEYLISKSSISRKLSSIRRLFNYAIRNDIIETNPIVKISNPKSKRKLPETINLDSFLEIFTLIDKENDINANKRDKAIFELLYAALCVFPNYAV
jgi:site-specific recombinase XerD